MREQLRRPERAGQMRSRVMSERRPVLFLDIDGVLNGHNYDEEAQSNTIDPAQSNTIDPACVAHLNRVIRDTDCALVISSAWRYMVLMGAMSLNGFEYLLQTHGVNARGRVIGTTGEDTQTEDPNERGRLIADWLRENNERVSAYAVVDDMDLGFEEMPFVRTDETRGLTDEGADELIRLLRVRSEK